MPAALTELLKAVDSYMKTNGGGEKFLAKKFIGVFNDKNSPFNMKPDGVMYHLSATIKNLADKVEALGEPSGFVDQFAQNITSINVELHILKNKINQTHKEFDRILKNLGSFNISSFLEDFQKIFTSKGVHKNYRKDEQGKRHYETGRAIDVNVVGMRKAFMESFFRGLQKRFSSESILSKPDSEGKEHRIHSMNVNVQHISEKVLEQIGKVKGRSDDITKKERKKEGDGGFLSKIFGWIADASMLLGGLFLLGKGKQFLDNTVLGKNIKSMFETMTSGISSWIKKYLDSGDLGNTLSDGIIIISDTFKFIFGSIYDFYTKNEESIKKTFNKVKDTLWDNVLHPIFHQLKEFLKNTDWGGILKDIGGFVWDNILKPWFSSIGDSLAAGDFMGAAGKAVIGILVGSMALGLNPFALALGTFASDLSLATSGLSAIALNPFALAAIALGASFGAVTYAINNLQSEIDRSAQLSTKQAISERLKQKKIKDQLKELDNKKELTYVEKLKRILLKSDLDRSDELIKFNQKMDAVKAENSGWWDSFTNAFTGNVDKKLKYIEDDYRREVEISDVSRAGIIEELAKMSSDASMRYNKTASQKQRDADDIVKSILEQRKDNTVHVKDAVVVQPHSKDQILMAKTGGPFDMAMKRMIEKLDEEIQILQDGFTMLIQATTSGSTQVAQTVAATASVKSNTSSIGGGRNPVGDFRTKANERIRR